MENIVIPEILKRFSKALIEKQRECISIKATPLDSDLDQDPLVLKQSKFLGKPFIPEDMEYPKDESGDPLVLIAQINFSELPHLKGFPSEGILQLYFNSTEWYDPDNAIIIYLSKDQLDKDQSSDIPTIDSSLYEELPIRKIHKLSFDKSIDTGNSVDSQFDFDFDGKGYWEFEETLSRGGKEVFDEYFISGEHKIGGYAYFTQSDPRDYKDSQRYDIQLLQIDIDDEIMFGDSGLGHIFISPDDLANSRFEKAYFYWDCY